MMGSPALRSLFIAFLLCSAFSCLGATKAEDDNSDNDNSQQQLNHHESNEDFLLSLASPSVIESHLFNLTQKSHVAGTKGDYFDANYVKEAFQLYFADVPGGADVQLETIPTMLSYPHQPPELYADFFRASLSEDVLPQDRTSDSIWRNHTFLAYSPGGVATAPLVYANFGRPQDFDVLEQQFNITVKGCIVIMRYGECFRGLKLMNAEKRGAVASILYTDPQQDGFGRGSTYPDGPWRPPSSVQRGSTQFISRCAGDPWRLYQKNRTKNQKVCGYHTKDLVPSRPALPISYRDAMPFLQNLGGQQAPSNFQGGLNISYSLGPSSFLVTLKTYNVNTPGAIPNVYARIPGTDRGAGGVILGNHRDAWVFGAVDPNSGTAVLLETARVFSLLLKQGWRPKRDIFLASWSGEEYGLLGSTAFTELHEAYVSKKAVAYLNVDEAVTGCRAPSSFLQVKATHSLRHLVEESASRIPAPPSIRQNDNETLLDQLRTPLETLGSGSDYTSFLDRYGVISLDMSYSGEYGVYHSVYDSFDWMKNQGDPTFECHQAMVRMWSIMSYRMSSFDILPIHMMDQGHHMIQVVAQMAESATKIGVDLTPLLAATDQFLQAAKAVDEEREQLSSSRQSDTNTNVQTSLRSRHKKGEHRNYAIHDLNNRLAYAERKFLSKNGLPNRPWFRHVLQAPGYYLGYGSQSFPGIVQAIEDHDTATAQAQVFEAAAAVDNAAWFLMSQTMVG